MNQLLQGGGRVEKNSLFLVSERLAEVNEILSRWAMTVLDPDLRQQALAAGLTRLDELEHVFHAKALRGNIPAAHLCLKISQRRAIMLGLRAPDRAVIEIVEKLAPRETSTDRIEAALNALLTDQPKKDDSTTH